MGGSIKHGHSIEETLERELEEEYGTKLISKKYLDHWEAFRALDNGTKTHWITFVYVVLIDPKTAKNGEPHKFDEVGWFPYKELPSPLHSLAQPFIDKFGGQIEKMLGV